MRIFEEETGRGCELTHVPEEVLEAQLASATDSLQASFAGLLLGTAREGQAIDMGLCCGTSRSSTSGGDYAGALVRAAQT